MDAILHFLGNFWWLIFVFGGTIGGAVKGIAAANQRRADRRLERYRLKQQAKIAEAEASGKARTDTAANQREVARVLTQHDETDERWFAYEVDLVTMLDFPMMTDMREPLTVNFHKAKRHADLLRPEHVEDLASDRNAQIEYRDAVHDYVAAFDVAELEAKRRRRNGFTPVEQQRLARAQSLLRVAMDAGATQSERQNAYAKARKELDGLIVVPPAAQAQIERQVRGEIEA